ncbi:MAG: hypothetical protein E7484_04010 [Ruminococcaceae bacterium]|nr:hypothetical protein [Oscillospiraceae bacterium]
MKKLFMAVFAAVLCLGMCGCSSAGTISTYTMVLDEMPRNLDPQVATSPEELLVITNTFDGLFEYVGGKVTKNVCQDYSVSSDGLTYTFTLRSDSSFYVNKNEQIPVTAADFVFAINRILDPKTKSPYYSDFANIASAAAQDDTTLIIRLKEADNNFLSKLCMPCAVPCNQQFFEETQGAYGLTVKTTLSNGPFTVNYLADDGSYATLIRTYASAEGIDRIRISHSDGQTPQADLYAADSISGYFADSSASGIECSNALFGMYFNPQSEALKNRNIRGALAYYCYGMENSGANLAAVTQNYSLFPSAVTLGDNCLNDLMTFERPSYMSARDPKDLLAQGLAELGTVKTDSLKVLVPNDVKYSVVVENINQLWQKNLGVFCSIEFLPSSDIEKRVAKGDFDIAFYSHTLLKNDPLEVLKPYSTVSEEISAHIDALDGKYLSNAEIVTEVEYAHREIIEMVYAVPMCTDHYVYVHKNFFSGIDVNPFGNIVNLKYAKVK